MDWFAHHDTWRWMNCIRHHLNQRNEASDSYVLGFGPDPTPHPFLQGCLSGVHHISQGDPRELIWLKEIGVGSLRRASARS